MSKPYKSEDINARIGQRIGILRGEKSQKEVADAIGVSREVFNHWEQGTRQIKSEHLVLLARYFNVTSDYLLGLPTALVPSDNEREQVIMDYTGLSQKALNNIISFKNKHPRIDVLNFLLEEEILLKLITSYLANFVLKRLKESPYKYIPLKRYFYNVEKLMYADIIEYLPLVKNSFTEQYKNNTSFIHQSIYNFLSVHADIKACKQIIKDEFSWHMTEEEEKEAEEYFSSDVYKSDTVQFLEEERERELAIDEFEIDSIAETNAIMDFLEYFDSMN